MTNPTEIDLWSVALEKAFSTFQTITGTIPNGSPRHMRLLAMLITNQELQEIGESHAKDS